MYHPSSSAADEAVRSVITALDGLSAADRLLALRSLSGLVASRRAAAVIAAREGQMSWSEIADRLGMSRQAVWQRFSPEEADRPLARRRGGSRPHEAIRPYSSCGSYKAVTSRPH